MALPRKVLLKKVQKCELKESEKNKTVLKCVSDLDELLNEVYLTRFPKPVDYDSRRDLIRIFNAIAKEIYCGSNDCPIVEGFGSFVMDIFTARSDLDLSINFGENAVDIPREEKIKTLHKFAKKLMVFQSRGHVTGVQKILSARVPIVKAIDCGTGVECDLSVQNIDGIAKSQIVNIISTIDERFQKLCFLMKEWAKAHDINSSKDRTLNSLSIISLVAFHLQTRDPPILPPFSALFKDGADPATVKKVVEEYLNYGQGNKEPLAVLFITLLVKLASVEKLWQKGLCASVFEGSWMSKKWDSEVGPISVEDFTDRTQNVARAVGSQEVRKIYTHIHSSLRNLLAFSNHQLQSLKLAELLFGIDAVTRGKKDIANAINSPLPRNPALIQGDMGPTNTISRPMAHGSGQTKKRRLTGGWGRKQSETESWKRTQQRGWEGNQQAYNVGVSNIPSHLMLVASPNSIPVASSSSSWSPWDPAKYPYVTTQRALGSQRLGNS